MSETETIAAQVEPKTEDTTIPIKEPEVPPVVQALQQLRKSVNTASFGLNKLIARAAGGSKFDRDDMFKAYTSIQATFEVLEAGLATVVRDLFSMSRVASTLELGSYQLSATVASLLEALKTKGVLSEKDVEVAWEEVVKKKYEAATRATTDAKDTQERASE